MSAPSIKQVAVALLAFDKMVDEARADGLYRARKHCAAMLPPCPAPNTFIVPFEVRVAAMHAALEAAHLVPADDALPKEVHDLIAWLLGEGDSFPMRPEKVEGKIQPLYWWRTELRARWSALIDRLRKAEAEQVKE